MADGVRIVVADDDPQVTELLRFKLERSGYEVLSVDDGGKAVDLVRTTRPDLAIVDIMMPVMDGFQVLRALKSDPDTMEIPVILLTARGLEEDIEKGYESEAVAYFRKPFSISELAEQVESLLEGPA